MFHVHLRNVCDGSFFLALYAGVRQAALDARSMHPETEP